MPTRFARTGHLGTRTAPIGKRNKAKKRTALLSVATTIMLPAAEISIKHTIWMLRSAKRPDVYVTTKETKKHTAQTGAVRSRVSIFPYPKVWRIVGKKYWNV
ncbi:hypothetical protein Daesc_003657 [Daldinia eschscholtzii]|uniref:Uncharacterized protein n=1 Tax=Daldinia eschscholtzii TaxID=292717 RepID=A0AAX6MTL6_9PEZI